MSNPMYWLQVLTELKNRGVDDAYMVVRDGSRKPTRPHAAGLDHLWWSKRRIHLSGFLPVCPGRQMGTVNSSDRRNGDDR